VGSLQNIHSRSVEKSRRLWVNIKGGIKEYGLALAREMGIKYREATEGVEGIAVST